ncbi:MAG: hypothetical protein M3281_03435 [Chloroflexota bacterium]|nr:hypothetical protein [Chloroflexota bacterium]
MPTYYAFRLALILARFLPRRVAYGICTLLGHLLFSFNRPAREVIELNMRRALGRRLTPHRLRSSVRRVFINLAKDYYELVLLSRVSREEVLELIDAEGLERIHEALKAGKGVLVVFFHNTGFNLAAQLALLDCWDAWVVAEPLQLRPMRELVMRLRSTLGLKLIPADRTGMRQIVRALRSNCLVVLAGDRDVGGTGVTVQLLGTCARLPAAAAALALRTGATILPTHIYRTPGNRIKLRVGEAAACEDTGDFETDVRRVTQALASEFEAELRRRPDQWVLVSPVWTACDDSNGRASTRSDLVGTRRR